MKTPPVFSTEQSRRIDQIAIEEYGMPSVVLMENAGRSVVETLVALGFRGPVLIACGRGNNAGDGLVIARHLRNREIPVRVFLFAPGEKLSGDAATNLHILRKMEVPFYEVPDFQEIASTPWTQAMNESDLLIDALLGTGATGAPRPPMDRVVEQMNASGKPILAIDLPSGFDADSGQPAEPAVRATHTCTFVTPKTGFTTEGAEEHVGQIHVMDIGIPRQIIDQVMEKET
jgi:NAD(P)H-hydrate epimerase